MNTRSLTVHATRQRGMGIVELMIGLLIGLIVSVALAWFYLGSRTLSRASDDGSRMQESGRTAIELIGMAVRQAGYRNNVNAAFDGKPITGVDSANNAPDTITLRFDAQEVTGELDCEGKQVNAGSTVEYKFVIDSSANPPALKCNDTKVVDNIEDMQITYGIDANKDGTIELYKTNPTAAEFYTVAAVRIALLVRGPSTNTAANKSQVVYFNGANLPAKTDGYLRQAYTATFAVRPQAW